jgi:protoheme IX farnesyltransferase
MSTTIALTAEETQLTWTARLADFWELTKPRIIALEMITIAAGFFLAAPVGWSPWVMLATLIGTGLVAGSASAFNMFIERHLDAKMSRTMTRPLPAQRMEPWQAVVFASILLVAGTALLLAGPGYLVTGVGLACWVLYVLIYTPLKTRSTLNTAVGAVSGGLPIVIGWLAAGGEVNLVLAGLFGVLYLWQYPHFMAIAWRCRDDYFAGGYVMSTTVDPTGRRAGREAIGASLLLFPVSLLPLATASFDWRALVYTVLAIGLTALFLQASILFARDRNHATSRRLLLTSLVYLPGWLAGLTLLAL